MKYILVLLFWTILIYSCKSQQEKEEETLTGDLRVFFKSNISDTTSTIDSFRLIKIDTITQFDVLREQSNILSNNLEELLGLYKLNTLTLSNDVSQLKLYGMLGSATLVDVQRESVNKTAEKGKAIKAEIDTLQKVTENIQLQISKADTIKPIGFEAQCFYQLRLKDKSVKRDTTYIQLNQNRDIIKRTDLVSTPYEVDFSKFR